MYDFLFLLGDYELPDTTAVIVSIIIVIVIVFIYKTALFEP
jgi:hypothetical protein